MLIHVVRPGEALWQISATYGVSIAKIEEINKLLNPDRLVSGQALVIPIGDFTYTVRARDTLWGIASTYGASIQSIMQINRITNANNIYPGLQIRIPAPRHTVQSGESLWQIASRYHVSVQNLLRVNEITNPNFVYPGMTLSIPIRPRPVIDVNGYIYQTKEQAAATVREDGPYLTYFSPFAYRIRQDGNLEPMDDTAAINAAREVRVVPMMAVTNFTSTELGNNLAHIVLSTPDIRERTINNIVNTMKSKGYKGVNIDFENVLPADRELYNQFLQTTVTRLHKEGYFVSTALAPKTSAGQIGALYEAHDYAAHGRIVDFVVLMTYEWGYRKGPPQAISPLNQIRRVLDYAVSEIPRNKLFFGFQLYARDWLVPHVAGQEAETFDMQEAILRAVRNGAAIQYDATTQSPFYRYRDTQGRMHEVWFEDARSAQAKFDTVKEYGLRGISYWVIGYPFPQNWALLEDNFTIRKLA